MITEFSKYNDIVKLNVRDLGDVWLYNSIYFYNDKYEHSPYMVVSQGDFYALRNYGRFNKVKVDTEPTWKFQVRKLSLLGDTIEEAKNTIDNYFTEIEAEKFNI